MTTIFSQSVSNQNIMTHVILKASTVFVYAVKTIICESIRKSNYHKSNLFLRTKPLNSILTCHYNAKLFKSVSNSEPLFTEVATSDFSRDHPEKRGCSKRSLFSLNIIRVLFLISFRYASLQTTPACACASPSSRSEKSVVHPPTIGSSQVDFGATCTFAGGSEGVTEGGGKW